ncbi:MAG: mycofactocin-coupled SDR family oxidoreductase [Mycobacteriales bacterium]
MRSAPVRYDNRVCFVTGAARGQGRAEAVRFAQEGADVAIFDICESFPTTRYDGPSQQDLADTAALVEKEGRRCLSFIADTRDRAALGDAVSTTVAELGGLDVVVANAGICTGSAFLDVSPEQFEATMSVNVSGTWNTLQATVPVLIEQGRGGSICVTSSVAGLRGLPFLSDYSASKHAITGMARSVANEVAQHGIRINTIHPGSVPTGMTTPELFPLVAGAADTLGPLFMNALPITSTPVEHIAAAVAWLCSDEAAEVTGIALPLDMGMLLR